MTGTAKQRRLAHSGDLHFGLRRGDAGGQPLRAGRTKRGHRANVAGGLSWRANLATQFHQRLVQFAAGGFWQ